MGQLDDTIGAIFVGLVLAAVLHGVTLSQAWHYFGGQGRQFQDPVGLKTLVAVVVAIDVVTQVSATVWCRTALRLSVLHPLTYGLVSVRKSHYQLRQFVSPYASSTILPGNGNANRIRDLACTTFLYLAYVEIGGQELVRARISFYLFDRYGRSLPISVRFYHLSNLVDVVDSSSITEGVMVGIIRTHDSKVFAGALNKLVIAVNAIGAALDAVIAIAMVYFLARQRTRVKKTNRILRQIAVHTLTTGAATSICAATVFILLIVLPFTQYELLFYQMLTRSKLIPSAISRLLTRLTPPPSPPQVYANSLLATLNVRDSIRTNMTHGNGVVTSSGRVTDRFPEFTAPAFATDTVTAGSYRLNDLKSIQTSEHHEGISIKVDTSTNVI
ncbi:hypothetical protein V5O48_005122 [Marasmius crinis-equi]|uniref:DUF6534 domain-containing protein n=1 Tax=Marasmius crinis-equi TaxID=585013 RepID=A0ABR3FN68_9AGAR